MFRHTEEPSLKTVIQMDFIDTWLSFHLTSVRAADKSYLALKQVFCTLFYQIVDMGGMKTSPDIFEKHGPNKQDGVQ